MNKKILIVSFSFPPYPGIGGRRWAKFAKALCHLGYDVFVLSAQAPKGATSEWTKDIEGLKLKRYFFKDRYPRVLIQPAQHLGDRIWFKVLTFLLSLFTKGNYFDRSFFNKKEIKQITEKIIKENEIETVIASGGPFHMLYSLAQLKQIQTTLNFIVDIRDPWANNQEFYGMSILPEKKKQEEKRMEKFVISQADTVFTVADEMTEYFRKINEKENLQIITLHNGFDPADFNFETKTQESEKTRFIFAGSLYPGTEYAWLPFLQALHDLKKNYPDIEALMQFDFYGQLPHSFIKQVKEFNLQSIQIHGQVPLLKIHEEISKSQYCLLFLNRSLNFSLSTKFFEYLAFNRMIVVCGESGATSAFVKNKGIGYGFEPQKMLPGFLELMKDFDSGKIQPNASFDRNTFSLPEITKKLDEILKG